MCSSDLNRWAPKSEAGNNPNSYAAVIAHNLGIGIHDRVPVGGIDQIANAQTVVEGGEKALQHFVPKYASGGLAGGRKGYEEGGPTDDFNQNFDETFAPKDLRDRIQAGQPVSEITKAGYHPNQVAYAKTLNGAQPPEIGRAHV